MPNEPRNELCSGSSDVPLPARGSLPAATPVPAYAPAPRDAARRVLLVEDSEVDAALMLRGLRPHAEALAVTHVESGDQALEMLAAQADVDLVLLDLNLPGTDGRAVLSAIKSDPRLAAVRVVVLTGSSHPGDIEFCMRHGADGYLTKPEDRSSLAQLVQHLLDFLLRERPLPPPPRL